MTEHKQRYFSPSQDNTMSRCNRLWWFERVQYVPQKANLFQRAFGLVFHSIMERWLLADDQGRVPEVRDSGGDLPTGPFLDGPLRGQHCGDAVELYPEGWETWHDEGRHGAPDEKYTLTPTEQRAMKLCVDKVIEDGLVQRWPDREIEYRIAGPFVDPVSGEFDVDFVGYVDLRLPEQDTIIDYKTSNTTKYFLSAGPVDPKSREPIVITLNNWSDTKLIPLNCVGRDAQLMKYAHELWQARGGAPGFVIKVVHVQVCRKLQNGKPWVRRVEALISSDVLAKHWGMFRGRAMISKQLRRMSDWRKVPGPNSPDACRQYGGCKMAGVCGGTESVEQYTQRVNRLLGVSDADDTTIEEPTMDLKAKMTAKIAAKKKRQQGDASTKTEAIGSPAAVSINGGTPEAKGPTEVPENAAPWFFPGCRCALKNQPGVNDKGVPCRVCDSRQAKAKGPTSALYAWMLEKESGEMVWTPKPEHQDAPVVHPLAGITKEETQQAVETLSTPAPEDQPSGADDQTHEDPVAAQMSAAAAVAKARVKPTTEAPKVATPKKGRGQVGLCIYVCCIPTVGPQRKTRTIDDVLLEFGQAMADESGQGSFYDLDCWNRRDALKKQGLKIAEALGTINLLAIPRDPDTLALLSALIPHAKHVVEGIQ